MKMTTYGHIWYEIEVYIPCEYNVLEDFCRSFNYQNVDLVCREPRFPYPFGKKVPLSIAW